MLAPALAIPSIHDPASIPDESPTDDAAVVRAVRGGDRAAFARLHERYAPLVHGILLARVTPDDADDLVQDVFLHAIRKLRTLRDDACFGPWIATMTRRFAVRHYRRRRGTVPLPAGLASEGDDPARAGRAEDDAQRVLAVIRGLPEAYGETLVLRLVEGLSGPEIAARSGLTHGSVRVNLHRGLRLLRQRLGLAGGEEDTP